jgi:hypothetical protein
LYLINQTAIREAFGQAHQTLVNWPPLFYPPLLEYNIYRMRNAGMSTRKAIRARLYCCAVAIMASNCLAMPDTIPPAYVVPTLNGLNIAYLMKQDQIKVNIYVINHEKFPVICDTEYESGPDKKRSLEREVMPGKPVAFGYDYAKKTGHIILQLVCIKSNPDSTDITTPPSDTPPSTTSSVAKPPAKESKKPDPVIEVEILSPH